MKKNLLDLNNVVSMVGIVSSDLEFSRERQGRRSYTFFLETIRYSGFKDRIPVIVSEKLIDPGKFSEGMIVKLEGQYRSYDQATPNGGSKLILYIYAKKLEILQQSKTIATLNEVVLTGTICKNPIYRTTPFGREITDILLAVNRAYNKSDYIPCILWGRNAKRSKNLIVGDDIEVTGRIQSRPYDKELEDGTTEIRMAYEVSVSKIEELYGGFKA